jgi:translation initiation factor 2B subunit (eIF-2B alpha/beta/delta family)
MVDVKGELRRIVHDKEMGSTQIAIAVLKRLAEIGKGKERRGAEALIATALEIATERASMPVIRNSLRELQSFVADVVDLERAVEGVIEGIVERTAASVSRLVGHLGKGIRVATFSYSSHALKAIAGLEPTSVEVPFCSPLNEGIRACAELRRLGIACNLSTDLDFLRRLKRCDAVVLGSDAVLLDGRIANRSGTSPLVERAYELGIGCYFMTDWLKLDLEGTWRNEASTIGEIRFDLFDLTEPLANVMTASSFGVLRPGEFVRKASELFKRSSSRG